MSASGRGTVLLALGAAAGITLAAAGLAGTGGAAPRALGGDAVARVNGTPIRLDEYRRTLAALAGDRRTGLEEDERRRVRERLIEEELLVQRGLELGLARHDPRVRRDLIAAVIESVVTEAEAETPSAGEVHAFYLAHRDRFVRPGRLTVRQIWCRAGTPGDDAGARARAVDAAARLARGEDFAAVRAALGDAELAPLPEVALPAGKLLDYLGPTALATALELEAGTTSAPVRSSTGWHVLQVLAREAPDAPPFADLEAEAAAEARRARGEATLRAYLDDLRARADVELAELP